MPIDGQRERGDKMNDMIKPIIVRITTCVITLLISGASVAAAGIPENRWGNQYKKSTDQHEVGKIVSVLEERIEDQRLLQKAKEKLSAMSEEEVHLIARLGERFHSESHTADGDIAFLLVTVLIAVL